MELAYVLKGSAIHHRNQTRTVIREGDYFVVDYESRHAYEATTDSFELINCLFMPELIDPALKDCRSLQTVVSSYQLLFQNAFFTENPSTNTFRDEDGTVRGLLLAMLEEFQTQAPGYLQIIRAKIIELLVVTMRKIYRDPRPGITDSQLDRVLTCIHTEYMQDLTLQQICRQCGYSFPYMSMKFKKTLSMTYTHYLQKIRVEQSMRLLVSTDKPVGEIAQAVGYRDIKAFYAAFRRFANTTPAKFRKQYNAVP